ncbi:MAG: hypothetical protein HN891_01195 [Planctomycetes bacterium]|jgi:hypothetical protein|nr:hypothetical protein [Planctomycetota bacterium]MBT7104084.1 hypothetical protein [Planctomycetota bacterium]MBT7129311.1 hypothetical protein [Planctomycetota bacterium]
MSVPSTISNELRFFWEAEKSVFDKFSAYPQMDGKMIPISKDERLVGLPLVWLALYMKLSSQKDPAAPVRDGDTAYYRDLLARFGFERDSKLPIPGVTASAINCARVGSELKMQTFGISHFQMEERFPIYFMNLSSIFTETFNLVSKLGGAKKGEAILTFYHGLLNRPEALDF